MSWSLTFGGMYGGVRELSMVRGNYWRGSNGKWYGLNWGGNGATGSRNIVLNNAGFWKGLGRFSFVGGVLISGNQFRNNPTWSQGIQSGTDIGMATWGYYGGPLGATASGIYFADQFLQSVWPSYQQFRSASDAIVDTRKGINMEVFMCVS